MRSRNRLLNLFLAAIGLAYGVVASGAAAEKYPDTPVLEEIIVSAQKRGVQSLQDIAMSAAVISSELIDVKQLVGMDDYLRTVPGVTYQDYGAGRSTIIIRGISADPQSGVGTTGVYINEAPLTGLSDFETSSPDLKLVDINRIEILRGPQGTLYGSGTLGGTVRIIAEPPHLDRFSGSLTGSSSYTEDLGGENYNAQAVVNIPMKRDEFAVRAVAYHYDNSGYYQNIAASDPVSSASAAATGGMVVDRDDVGSSKVTGGRISARWDATDKLKIDMMYLAQEIEQEGNPYGDLRLSNEQHARFTRVSTGRSEFTEDDLSSLNLMIEYDFDAMSLVSSSSWSKYENVEDWDVGQFWVFIYGDNSPIFLKNITDTDIFVQEVRIGSRWDKPFNFLVGAYYEDRNGGLSQLLEIEGVPDFDPIAGELLYDAVYHTKTEQLAVFGELSWEFIEEVIATAGVRHFDYQTSYNGVGDGVFGGGPFVDPGSTEEDDNTYKLNLSYTPNEHSLFYAQWSQGFNLGLPLSPAPDTCDLDGDGLIDGLGLAALDRLLSDTLDSYEIGGKVSFMDNRVDVRAAAFYNEWTKIPITLTGNCGFHFLFNAGEAMTAGFELEGSAQLSAHWRLDFSAGYTKGELTSDAPGLGVDGERLPGTPEYTATLGVQYDFVYSGHDGFFRADMASVGGFYNNLQKEGDEIGDYTTINLAAGLQIGRWGLQIFIQNLTNSRASTWINHLSEIQSSYHLRPRTTGLSLSYAFGDAN